MGLGHEAAEWSIDAKIATLSQCRQLIASATFASAVTTIFHNTGKLVVTGIGKSGHIGRKIAATMISTGTRAVFLHPAEAAHGDMGLIDRGDSILMLSNSGETGELNHIMDVAAERFCPVIILTSRPEGRLSVRANMVLAYPRGAEGCPVDRAPMASTAAQLALGDALAAQLMAARGFTAADFAINHHGGYLGRSIAAVA